MGSGEGLPPRSRRPLVAACKRYSCSRAPPSHARAAGCVTTHTSCEQPPSAPRALHRDPEPPRGKPDVGEPRLQPGALGAHPVDTITSGDCESKRHQTTKEVLCRRFQYGGCSSVRKVSEDRKGPWPAWLSGMVQ